MLSGFIFDLDGTLLDTLGDIGNAANAVLAAHGYPTHPIAAYRAFVGDGVRMLMTRALPAACRDEGTLDACLETMKGEYARHLNQTAQPYPGVLGMVRQLKERGFKMGVLSNKGHEFTGRCVRDFFGPEMFHPIFGLREGVPRKPDPAGAWEIAQTWGMAPGAIGYLGDSGTDMETAVRAGMFPIGVSWGYRDEEELREWGARVVIREPAELGEVVRGTTELGAV